MVDAQGGDGEAVRLEHVAFREFVHSDEVAEIGPPLVRDPDFDIEFQRLREFAPVSIQAARAVNPDRSLQPRRPGGVKQRTEFEDVIGMEMGDEDQVATLEVYLGIGQAARHS